MKSEVRNPKQNAPSLLVAGTKYGEVAEQVERRNAGLTKAPSVRTSGPGKGLTAEEKLEHRKRGFNTSFVFVPRLGKEIRFEEWFWQELREGGYLRRYIEREKGTSARRVRCVARQMDGFQQNNKSDWRLKAAIPAREYYRWKREDEHFWEDDKNLRSFKRDNPEACVYV